MLRQFLFFSVGALALVVVLGAPDQLYAQHMRGGFSNGMHPAMRSRVMPGFRGAFAPRFNSRFTPGFGRFGLGRFERFEDRFGTRFPMGRFDRFEDRLENRRFFTPFSSPGFFPPF